MIGHRAHEGFQLLAAVGVIDDGSATLLLPKRHVFKFAYFCTKSIIACRGGLELLTSYGSACIRNRWLAAPLEWLYRLDDRSRTTLVLQMHLRHSKPDEFRFFSRHAFPAHALDSMRLFLIAD